jgi:hypothetical protein
LLSLVICLANGMNLQTKVPGVKSVISKASGAKADHFVDHGDKIHFGNLFLEVQPHSNKLLYSVLLYSFSSHKFQDLKCHIHGEYCN